MNKIYKTILLLSFIAILLLALKPKSIRNSKSNQINIQIAYPVQSLSPLIYDDWSGTFIGNHIYVRLIDSPSRTAALSLTKSINITSVNGPRTARSEVRFNVEPIINCNGTPLKKATIRFELEKVVQMKNWILPGYERCSFEHENEICFTTNTFPELRRNLENIYFRFGWSLNQELRKDVLFGSGNYCLKISQIGPNSEILGGQLIKNIYSKSSDNLPEMKFYTSTDKSNNFDINLYGSSDLLNNDRINLQANTPLSYYVVTNKTLRNAVTPWSTSKFFSIVKDELFKSELIYKDVDSFDLLPKGNQTKLIQSFKPSDFLNHYNFYIPDYLPNCEGLASRLNIAFNLQNSFNCTNTVTLIDKIIHNKPVSWDGFLTPLSPGTPSKNGLAMQYFSSISSESYTKNFPTPELLYRLVGIGQSLVTVKKNEFCSIRPVVLGLGDLLISDFEKCH